MKSLKNHIILSLLAFVATNVFFVILVLIDSSSIGKDVVEGLSFPEFVAISNGALIIIAAFSINFRELGNRILEWGYSNLFRGFILILLSVIIFVLSSLILFGIHFFVLDEIDVLFGITSLITGSYYESLVFFFVLISTLMFFISNLERRSGDITRLIAQSMGEIIKPNLVNRGFIFIDLNDATSLAERLGSERYAELVRICFKMLNDILALTPFEVYQYVGDEAVITWEASRYNANLMALQMFTDFKAFLKEHDDFFISTFGESPRFKCAIHLGEAVESEIGKNIKHLVYHGDVLNTTSRLLDSCHKNGTDLIISKSALGDSSVIGQKFILKPLKKMELKGKRESIDAFGVTIRPNGDQFFNTYSNTNFFLNIN